MCIAEPVKKRSLGFFVPMRELLVKFWLQSQIMPRVTHLQLWKLNGFRCSPKKRISRQCYCTDVTVVIFGHIEFLLKMVMHKLLRTYHSFLILAWPLEIKLDHAILVFDSRILWMSKLIKEWRFKRLNLPLWVVLLDLEHGRKKVIWTEVKLLLFATEYHGFYNYSCQDFNQHSTSEKQSFTKIVVLCISGVLSFPLSIWVLLSMVSPGAKCDFLSTVRISDTSIGVVRCRNFFSKT